MRLIGAVDSVLWEVWDPIGVNDVPEARDEYASYAPGVAGLLRSGASDDEIRSHLATIVAEWMGLPPVDPDPERRTLAALRALPLTVWNRGRRGLRSEARGGREPARRSRPSSRRFP
jgi:hypothetical protein